jgi:hypothetical protein
VGEPVSLVPRNVGSAEDRRELPGRCIPRFVFVGPSWGMHSSVCLGSPCKVINQSIIGLSLLSETN